VSWTLVLALAAGAYGFKVLGFVVLGGRRIPARLVRCLALVPAALLSALVLHDTFALDRTLVVDERAAGIAVAAVAAWRRASLIVVIVLGAAVTALLRRFS